MLVAVVKKQMRLDDLSLYTIIQILSVTLLEKESLSEVLSASQYNTCKDNQMKLLAINRTLMIIHITLIVLYCFFVMLHVKKKMYFT